MVCAKPLRLKTHRNLTTIVGITENTLLFLDMMGEGRVNCLGVKLWENDPELQDVKLIYNNGVIVVVKELRVRAMITRLEASLEDELNW